MANHPERISRPAIWSFLFGIIGFFWITLDFIDLDSVDAPTKLPDRILVMIIILSPIFSLAAIVFAYNGLRNLGLRRRPSISFAVTGIGLALLNLACWFVPHDIFVDNTRSIAWRSKNDMRTLSTALEKYYIDFNSYPESTSDTSKNLYAHWGPNSKMATQPTFASPSAGYETLLIFTDAIPTDPFAPVNGAPICYYSLPRSEGWILWSAGPDRKYDLTLRNIGSIYKRSNLDGLRNPVLQSLTYDVTNGTKSAGDIWRVRG